MIFYECRLKYATNYDISFYQQLSMNTIENSIIQHIELDLGSPLWIGFERIIRIFRNDFEVFLFIYMILKSIHNLLYRVSNWKKIFPNDSEFIIFTDSYSYGNSFEYIKSIDIQKSFRKNNSIIENRRWGLIFSARNLEVHLYKML